MHIIIQSPAHQLYFWQTTKKIIQTFMKSLPLVVLACLACLIQQGYSQVHPGLHRCFSLGVSASESGYDTGIGAEVGTPSLFANRISFRAKVNHNWLEIYKATYNQWAKYETASVTMVYNTMFMGHGRASVDVGIYNVFPDNKFSSRKSIHGITSAIGAELFIHSRPNLNVCYYFSGGINYIRAYAERLENKPRYANGIAFSTGFRFYLPTANLN
jgi:hypothetical protein